MPSAAATRAKYADLLRRLRSDPASADMSYADLASLSIVFLGGLALNLTPCVLPMIPINLAIIGAGAQAGSRRRGFLLGLT